MVQIQLLLCLFLSYFLNLGNWPSRNTQKYFFFPVVNLASDLFKHRLCKSWKTLIIEKAKKYYFWRCWHVYMIRLLGCGLMLPVRSLVCTDSLESSHQERNCRYRLWVQDPPPLPHLCMSPSHPLSVASCSVLGSCLAGWDIVWLPISNWSVWKLDLLFNLGGVYALGY